MRFLLLLLISLKADAALGANPWLRILHMREGKSSIEAPEFFLTPDGRRDPDAEWQALIDANPEQQRDYACRFPARILIFEKTLGRTWPAPPCNDYLVWKEGLSFRSLSLVYSTAYAGNPASILGHNILKLNRDAEQPLLDYGLSFQAENDPTDSAVFYVLNGLFGGYPGAFHLQPYYELANTYAYAENRDLWEMEIKLSLEERQLFLAHAWELIHAARTPYFFTHVNCSTMTIETLDAIKADWNLQASFSGLVLPQAVMQIVAAAASSGHEEFRPSQKRIFDQNWRLLKQEQKELFLDWRRRGQLAAVADDPLVLDIIIDQITLEKSQKNGSEQGRLRAVENQVLLARSQWPALTRHLPSGQDAQNNPLQAHGIHKVTLFGGQDGSSGFVGARLRYGLHDLLDAPEGFDPYYHVNFLDLRITPRTHDFQLVDIWSLTPMERLDPSGSWLVQAGADQDGARLHGGYGAAWELKADRSLIYALPDLDLRRRESRAGILFGWYHSFNGRWRQLLGLHPMQGLQKDSNVQWNWEWEQRLGFGKQWQLEWRLAREERVQAQVGLAQMF